jgi:hypothetical protein
VPRFSIDVEARLASFEAGLKRIEQSTAGVAGRLESAFGGLRSALAAIGGVVAVGQITNMVRSFVDAADALDDLSQKTGVAVESLSELQYTANIEGVNVQSLGDAFTKLSVNLQAGARGSKELQAAFAQVGIAAKELGTIGGDQAFRRIAAAFEGAADGPEKAALAVKLFGRAGADLIPLLNYGADGLKRSGDEARRFGLVIGADTAKAAAEFNDNLTKLRASAQGFGFSLGNEVLPSLSRFVAELLEGQRIFGSFASALANLGNPFNINPFKDLAGNIAAVRKEIELLERQRNNSAAEGNTNLGGFDASIERARKRLEFLKFQQRQSISTGDPSTFDSRDRRLQAQGSGKPGFAPDTGGGDDLREQIEKGSQKGAEFLLKIYTDQFSAIRREAVQLQTELVSILQEGPAEAQRQAQARQSALDGVLGQTQVGRVRELQQLLEDLARAGAQAPLEMQEQYEQAFEIINQQIQEANGKLDGQFDNIVEGTDLARDGFLRLQAAIERWGDATADEIVKVVQTGKLNFSSLINTIAADLLRLSIQQSITRPLFTALAASLPGGPGAGAPTAAGTPFGFSFGGGRAAGGNVSGGRYYTVGERGPETLFVNPGQSGTIVPNGGGSAPVSVYLDARTDSNLVRQYVLQAVSLAQSEQARRANMGA